MWRHPKYYKELKRIAKEEADKRASEQARRVGGPTSNEPGSEQASERSSVRGASEQATLNMIPIVDCEGRCFSVIEQKTGDRATLV